MSIIEKALKRNSVGKSGAEKDHADSVASERLEELRAGQGAHDDSEEGSVVARPVLERDAAQQTNIPDGPAMAEYGSSSESLDAPSPKNRPYLHLDFDELQTRGFLTPIIPRSRMAEEFRLIKRPLLKNIGARSSTATPVNSNLVMVTSALQGDGKTFCSINLAISIAMEKDTTVLFVDADVVKATAGKILGVPESTPGLIDLIADGTDIEPADVIMRTNIDNLSVLPAGNASDKSTELLASTTMRDFMVELSNRYRDRVIVFDSPPLLLTTESSVLASFMGQIVFIASADVTPQAAVREALEHISEDKMAGVVLNRASQRRSKLLGIGSYGYGYGYGSGYDYGRGREPSAESSGAE